MKKAFVTGATGFLGTHLLKELTEKGMDVYALCRKNTKNIKGLVECKKIHLIYGSLDDMDNLKNLCTERDFDVFYHLAWEGASGLLRQDGEVQIKNVLWTYKAAKAAIDLRCKKMVVSGTICENQCESINKLGIFHAASYYLNAKAASYAMISSFCRQMGMPLVWCTFYHPVGKYNKPEQLITNTIYKMLHGDALKFGTAQGLFDVVAAEDLCHGLYLAGNTQLKTDRYFIGSGTPSRLMDYLEKIKMLLNKDAFLQYGYYKTYDLPMEPEWLDVSPFQKETGYKAGYSFEEIVLAQAKWLLSNPEL